MSPQRRFWTIVLSSAAILAVTMGIRQSTGLFVSPINTATGLGIVTISFALAIGQFVWGVAQPLFGMLALAAATLSTILLALPLREKKGVAELRAAEQAAGITLSEQIRIGSYDWIWYADIVLAAAAALVNLPIREAHPKATAVPAAA